MFPIGMLNEFIVGILLPLVLAAVMQYKWSDTVRAFVFLGACIAASALMFVTDTNEVKTFPNSVVYIAVTAGVFFKTIWRPAGVTDRIEAATQFGKSRSYTAHTRHD